MSRKAERTRLLEQIFADRLPQLDAATNGTGRRRRLVAEYMWHFTETPSIVA